MLKQKPMAVVKGVQNEKTVSEKYRLVTPLVTPPEDYDLNNSYDWHDYLDRTDFKTVAVEKFKTAPLSDIFHHLRPNLKVEIPNKDYFHYSQAIGGVFWVAQVVKIVGYRALLRYEGYGSDSSADFWMNFCSNDLHPVGWCATTGRPLVPPKALQDKQDDWKSYLVKRLTGARTLPSEWQEKVKKAVSDCTFKVGQRLELVDRAQPERVRPANLVKVVGKRLKLVYSEADQPKKENSENPEEEEEMELWYDHASLLIFPVGWAVRVGYGLFANDQYRAHCKTIVESDPEAKGEGDGYSENDTRPTQFRCVPRAKKSKSEEKDGHGDKSQEVPEVGESLLQFRQGMKLECIDPIDMTAIAVATVKQVLKEGYLKIQFDGRDPDGSDEDDTFPFHKDSPYLFPVGYCHANSIPLRPPKGTVGEFKWEEYLKASQAVGAPAALFDCDQHDCPFEAGVKLEAVDMVEPKLICVATVIERKGGRLLKIRFDGWDASFDQWQDYRSPDLHAVGWCEIVGYKLEAPKVLEPQQELEPPSKRVKTSGASGGSKKKTKRTQNEEESD